MPEKEIRLIDILAELCYADPAYIEWDGSGSADLVRFRTSEREYLLKLSRDNTGCSSGNTQDFRVRVITA